MAATSKDAPSKTVLDEKPSKGDTTTERARQVTADPRWKSLLGRDSGADGSFFYSVSTTGIYCRPSCAARHPQPHYVRFHTSGAQAELAGFRPCLRCKPNQPLIAEQQTAKVTEVCRLIEMADAVPSLASLAQQVGVSRHHLHRLFKAVTGLTPRQYAVAQRNQRLRQQLEQNQPVTDAIYAAGYNTNSRFYEETDHVLGMTPKDYRAGGANTHIRFAVGECTLGAILVAQSERGVCSILMGDDPDELSRKLQDQFPQAQLVGDDNAFEQTIATVVGFIEAPALGLALPLDIRGTVFQQRVWQALREIPVGETASYIEIARRINAPTAARAVARACATNILAVAIPCHRVVRTDGGLSGYRWGVERKKALLALERMNLPASTPSN